MRSAKRNSSSCLTLVLQSVQWDSKLPIRCSFGASFGASRSTARCGSAPVRSMELNTSDSTPPTGLVSPNTTSKIWPGLRKDTYINKFPSTKLWNIAVL